MSTAQLRMTSVRVTSRYGSRTLNGKPNFHKGVDFGFGHGVAVSAFGGGVVTESAKHAEYGWYVRIEHAPGIVTSYHSLSERGAAVGTQVKLGDTIGKAGSSAAGATGPHLHAGLWFNGAHVDPLAHLKAGEVVEVSTGGAAATTLGRDDILWIQRRLNIWGYPVTVDGVFGSQTRDAVKAFQKRLGLTVDGVVGAVQTSPALAKDPAPVAAASGRPTIEVGSNGDAVRVWQSYLRRNYPLYAGKLVVDGTFGNQTAAATREWQKRSGITVDGVVGPQSWKKAGL